MAHEQIITKINLADIRIIELNINQQIILEEIGIIYLEDVTIAHHKRYFGNKTQHAVTAICGDDKKSIKKWAYRHKPQLFN